MNQLMTNFEMDYKHMNKIWTFRRSKIKMIVQLYIKKKLLIFFFLFFFFLKYNIDKKFKPQPLIYLYVVVLLRKKGKKKIYI